MTRGRAKSIWVGAAIILMAGGTAIRLAERWREEKADDRLMILADWSEVRDASARQDFPDRDLLARLASAGANAILVSPSTVQDYLWRDMTFNSRVLAESVAHQLEVRGVTGVQVHSTGGRFVVRHSGKNWEELKDVELGFNPELLGLARQAGLRAILRVNYDPWVSKENLFAEIGEIGASNEELGFLFNTDEVPGGKEALPQWISLLNSQGYLALLFEFHPSKSALKAAYRSPQTTYRAHTIPSAELKDLDPVQEIARWRRAVQERSCRFLLFHMAPADSLVSFLENVNETVQDFTRHGWQTGWPRSRLTWHFPGFVERTLASVMALLIAMMIPAYALRTRLDGSALTSYVGIFLVTLAGACVMSALADNPLSRIEVVPFRGVKLAFAVGWLGSFFMLYTWSEIQRELDQAVRRIDVVFAIAMLAVVGYFLVRTGNAGSSWKAGWEQSVRDRLEFIFVARPRFKEFAIGYPLLILGLNMNRGAKSFWQDGRFWIGVGMIGPISMINTFCHLHSPLYLAFFRSMNGFLLGTLVGLMILGLKKCRS